MPASTSRSRAKKLERVMPETAAVAKLQAQLGEYDQKLRQLSNEVSDKSLLAEKLMRIADEAISMAASVQLIKSQGQLDNQKPSYQRIEQWLRQAQNDAKRLMS